MGPPRRSPVDRTGTSLIPAEVEMFNFDVSDSRSLAYGSFKPKWLISNGTESQVHVYDLHVEPTQSSTSDLISRVIKFRSLFDPSSSNALLVHKIFSSLIPRINPLWSSLWDNWTVQILNVQNAC